MGRCLSDTDPFSDFANLSNSLLFYLGARDTAALQHPLSWWFDKVAGFGLASVKDNYFSQFIVSQKTETPIQEYEWR